MESIFRAAVSDLTFKIRLFVRRLASRSIKLLRLDHRVAVAFCVRKRQRRSHDSVPSQIDIALINVTPSTVPCLYATSILQLTIEFIVNAKSRPQMVRLFGARFTGYKLYYYYPRREPKILHIFEIRIVIYRKWIVHSFHMCLSIDRDFSLSNSIYVFSSIRARARTHARTHAPINALSQWNLSIKTFYLYHLCCVANEVCWFIKFVNLIVVHHYAISIAWSHANFSIYLSNIFVGHSYEYTFPMIVV